MQFDGLNLPTEGANEDWVRDTNARDDVQITVPLAIEEDGIPWVLGASIFSETAVSILYFNFGQWNLLTEYSLENDIIIHSDDRLQPGVGLQGKDARIMRKLALKLGEKLKDIYRTAFIPYVKTDMGSQFKTARESCDCESIGEPQVQVMQQVTEVDGGRVYVCGECMKTHGLEYDRRPIRKEKAFDANWVLDGEMPDEFVDIDQTDSYLLYSAGEPAQKIEHMIGVMNTIGGGISESFSTYNPAKHEALVYVQEDTIAGYLTWTSEENAPPSLQQLFTREDYRREGVASTLIASWAEAYCDYDIFYVEEPNEQSRNLLKKLGYWSGEKQPKAVEHYLLRGATNDFEKGLERGKSHSRTQKRL